ncbi:hypothetical protein [Vibrio phage CKB-S1]|nr:hypothetical protein [Vibrio phage CKB-S1]
MPNEITVLIQNRDGFEIVRDMVAQILVDESARQMQLATDAGLNAEDWRLNVFRERSAPWDLIVTNPEYSHAVNVWFDASNVDENSADVTNRQTFIANINIDIATVAEAVDTDGDGYEPADRAASLYADRILRLCRNILMSSTYTYLNLRQIDAPNVAVGKRWVRSMNKFQPQLDNKASEYVWGARLELSVRYSEYSPQYQAEALRTVDCVVNEADDGRVLAGSQFNFEE